MMQAGLGTEPFHEAKTHRNAIQRQTILPGKATIAIPAKTICMLRVSFVDVSLCPLVHMSLSNPEGKVLKRPYSNVSKS